MAVDHLIPATDFCIYYDVEYTFISSLHEAGLVTVTVVNETTYIPESELQKLEKMIRLHHDLEINIAGIEAISNLLEQMEQMQENIRGLRNRLRLYEADAS